MFRFLAPCGFALAPLLAVAASGTASSSSSSSGWTRRPAYPLPPGVAGAIAGAHGGVLIAAGGANFPDKMPWDGGKKIYYDEIFVIAPGDTAWRSAGKLPERRAYSASVSLADGVLVLGGENSETIFSDSLLLRWDGRAVVVERGPALPAPRTSQVAAVLDGSVYVAGGYAPGAVRVSTGDFWRLDLAHRAAGWKKLPSWPGPTRAQGTIAALDGAIYLISGLEMVVGADGKGKPTYLADAFCFRAEKWERLPDPPWSAVAVPSPAPVTPSPAPARIWMLGGVDSRLVGKQPRDTRVPDHIMYFDVAAHAWKTVAERWPDPVVTAPAVQFGSEWWIVSGEIMAGVRTTSVWSWQPGAVR
jgi:N-acetylneuraminic acid mutarotase